MASKRKEQEDHEGPSKQRKLVEEEKLKEDDSERFEELLDELGEAREKLEDEDFNPVSAEKKSEEFRNYKNSARQGKVQQFYDLQHTNQTYDFVSKMEEKWLSKYKLPKAEQPKHGIVMGVWEALEYLDQIIDDSDPDTNFTQVAHALQTAEDIRKKWPQEEYDWFVLTGLIHDLGKIMAVTDAKRGLVGEPQWCVVGDTYPVGVPFSDRNVFSEFFQKCPDYKDSKYNSGTGMFEKGCGLMNLKMCWGHDEYMYHVAKNYSTLPIGALYMLRFHSFYPWHKEGAYREFMDKQDEENFHWVKEFNSCDLYSKSHEVPDAVKLKPYYQKLIAKYFPEKVVW